MPDQIEPTLHSCPRHCSDICAMFDRALYQLTSKRYATPIITRVIAESEPCQSNLSSRMRSSCAQHARVWHSDSDSATRLFWRSIVLTLAGKRFNILVVSWYCIEACQAKSMELRVDSESTPSVTPSLFSAVKSAPISMQAASTRPRSDTGTVPELL